MGTIFVAGIHGVGKSTLCEKLSSDLCIDVYSAGDLISQINTEVYGSNKTVINPNRNQDILIEQVKQILNIKKKILLAGHFCVLDTEMQINRIGTKVFEGLKIERIILLEAPAKKVLSNLYFRDGRQYEEKLIEEMLSAEREHAVKVSKKIGVSLAIHNMNFDDSDVKECINYINGGE